MNKKDYTQSNPGCYHSMLAYLSELSGISARKEIKKNKVIYSLGSGKPKLQFKSWDIIVVDREGNKHSYMENCKRYDERGIVVDHFLVMVNRSLDEFGIEIEDAGSYKDCLGGGWHQMVQLFKVNDQYFATMDCSC